MTSFKWKKETVITTATGQTASTVFTVEPWAIFFMALFPVIDNGDVGLELSIDGGSNFYPVIDPADGADVVLIASGNDPGWIDFSDYIRGFGDNDEFQVRFTFAAQDPVISITVLQRG
jgi:hypothetical protein